MAAMAASPPKNAPAFEQTWDENDAAFLNPTSLPIAKVPRAWERKQEVKAVGNGKQKTVWRRYITRSRTTDTAQDDQDEDAEALDSRARPVKRRQRMSPKAIEKSAASRAFKTTRWDRRKSVLPRKKAAAVHLSASHPDATAEEEEEEQNETVTDLNGDSFSEMDANNVEAPPQEMALLPEGEDRRATFTSLFQEDENEMDHDAPGSLASVAAASPLNIECEDQDATIAKLFQSADQTPADRVGESTERLEYPELPPTATSEDEANSTSEQGNSLEAATEAYIEVPTAIAQLEAGHTEEDVASEMGDSPQQMGQCEQLVEEPKLDDEIMQTPEIAYPPLPVDLDFEEPSEHSVVVGETDNAVTASAQTAHGGVIDDIDMEDEDDSPDEEFTEASLQLEILRDMQFEPVDVQTRVTEEPTFINNNTVCDSVSMEGPTEPTHPTLGDTAVESLPPPGEDTVDDITAGLTLGQSVPSSREPTPRKLRSPSPPPHTETGPEDATMTFALDDDTALLKDFLSRAAASKANKVATFSRRESLQNRRDSDVVRHALASPRKVLEDKDPNSPSKYDNDATLDLSQSLTLCMEPPAPMSPATAEVGEAEAEAEDVSSTKSGRTSRRSSRARKSRLPAPSSVQTGPPKIAVRRVDGEDPVVLKKTDAQELSLLTRANTRKNKQGAVVVNVRLLKLSNDARTVEDSTIQSDPPGSVVKVPGKKYVRWDSQLAYFQEGTDTMANMIAEAESLATPDELSLPLPSSTNPAKVKQVKDKNATPKLRRVRGLGTTNGTPGKGLLAPVSLLPDAFLDDKEDQQQTQRLPKPKSSRSKKIPVAGTPASDTAPGLTPADSKLPVLELAPVGIEPITKDAAKERRSRLATPKKVKLPQHSVAVPGLGKENQRTGLAAATPKKGIPVPSVVVPPTVGMETGLPRRRARKL